MIDLTERSLARVERTLDRLEHRWGGFPTREDQWTLPPREYRAIRERFEAGTVGGAGVWCRREGAVLLVRDADAEGWSEPAGKQEPGESLVTCARRECREETGIRCAPTGIAQAQHLRIGPEEGVGGTTDGGDAGSPTLHRLVVTFEAECVGGRVRPEPADIEAVAWWRRRPDELRYEALSHLPFGD